MFVENTGQSYYEIDFAGSEALVGVKVVNSKPHVDPFVFPVVLSSLNFLHSVRSSPSVPRNKQINSKFDCFVSPVGHDVAS